MLSQLPPNVVIAIKKYLYLIVFVIAAIPYWSILAAESYGYHDAFAWSGMLFIFVLLPLLDFIVGQDPANPNDEQVEKMDKQLWYPFLTLMAVPAQFAVLIYGAYIFTTSNAFSFIGQIGWVLSCGIVSAILAINVGHELIHKSSRTEYLAGGILYASVCYSGFIIEHIRGHHKHVSTPEDASSARFGQTVYQFLPHAYLHNFLNAWKLEAKRLNHLGLPAFHWRNELIWWNALSIVFALCFAAAFSWLGLVFYLGVSWMAFTTLEIINYVEHYGLHRRKLDNGRYERTTAAHSWNSNFLFTNMGLFHLQRHSDHHAFPKRRYQVLRHYDQSPQLPNGYAGMYVLALIPPLWFKVMNPRVKAYYQGEEWQLTNQQFAQAAKAHSAT